MSNIVRHKPTIARCDAWIAGSGAEQIGGASDAVHYSISQDNLRALIRAVFKAGTEVDVVAVKYREKRKEAE